MLPTTTFYCFPVPVIGLLDINRLRTVIFSGDDIPVVSIPGLTTRPPSVLTVQARAMMPNPLGTMSNPVKAVELDYLSIIIAPPYRTLVYVSAWTEVPHRIYFTYSLEAAHSAATSWPWA